jgi:hypothetical protein
VNGLRATRRQAATTLYPVLMPDVCEAAP